MSWVVAAKRTPPVPMAPGETFGQWANLDSEERQRRSDEVWAAGKVDRFPLSWIGRLMERWRGRRAADKTDAKAEANLAHLAHTKAIQAACIAGVPADAGDAEIVQEAKESARDMVRRIEVAEGKLHRGVRERIRPAVIEVTAMEWELLPPVQMQPIRAVSPWSVDWPERVRLLALWAEVVAWLDGRGLAKYLPSVGPLTGIIKRATCERWWRRVLRRVHASAVEATARAIGLVSRRAGCYASDDTVKRRAAQVARNAAALESVHAVNDKGQDYTLAELAAKGPANREIRRHELMTRIAGFEVVARECGHEALFVTVTCPSRMHAVRTNGPHDVVENERFDGLTTPDVAQAYLVGQWARFRSACERWGVELYGFRIAEPNHDGTPHWHALLFMPGTVGAGTVKNNPRAGRPVALRVAARLLRRYFWREAGTDADRAEQGARRHRVKVERIDWARGSAAGYVAKYIAKNIDGYRVEKDLYGNDAITSSQRVDAWASTWRIRQFQQIGGAPVTIWRELRRLHPDQAQAAPVIELALDACNVAAKAQREHADNGIGLEQTAAHGWASYLDMQGGHRVRRADLRVRLMRESTGEVGRYGDAMPPRAVGVVTTGMQIDEVQPVGIVMRTMQRRLEVTHEVESERCTWITVPADCVPAVVQRLAGDGAGVGVGAGAEGPCDPWSPVNNCTRAMPLDMHPDRLFLPEVRRRPKVGRWHAWGGAGQAEKGAAKAESAW